MPSHNALNLQHLTWPFMETIECYRQTLIMKVTMLLTHLWTAANFSKDYDIFGTIRFFGSVCLLHNSDMRSQGYLA